MIRAWFMRTLVCGFAVLFCMTLASCDVPAISPSPTAAQKAQDTALVTPRMQAAPLTAPGIQKTPAESPSVQTTPAAAPVKSIPISANKWKALPRIDGSTATIPFSEGLAQSLLRVSAAEAMKIIQHNTTHDAYVNLIEGRADIIFVTEPSAGEIGLAARNGVYLEVIPIVREGFVFLINKSNPVESLTVEQIRDIYQGKITNWKEVGGADEAIHAYQRPVNSGSQTLMLSLVMGDRPLMDAPGQYSIAGMDGLVETIAAFDTGETAIGYSVFYYATDMYVREGAKLLAVNGVFPDKKTISSKEYPFVSAYYAVFNNKTPNNSETRKLLQWILSEEGQKVADAAGYVPLQMK